jgi:HD-like signal output (HDOD) protein
MCGTRLSTGSPLPSAGLRPGSTVPPKAAPAVPGTAASDNRLKPKENAARTTPPAPIAPSESQVRLKNWVEHIQSQKEIPAFSHHIMQVMGMMGSDEASLRTLTNIILRDYSLTLAVLRLANSAYYNRSGKPVCSVSRAVTLMGLLAVKRLAGGILLLEKYETRPTGLKELLLLSMLTASHSYQAAQQLHLRDPEQVYMCGMFRNLGEVLISLYFKDTYEKILREMQEHNLTSHEACLKVMDFTYETLGRVIAASWKLPNAVVQTMVTSNPANFPNQGEEDKVKTLVSFSHDLTHCIYRCAPEDRARAIGGLLEKYSSIPDMNPGAVEKMLDQAVTITKETFDTVGVPLNELHLRHQFELESSGSREAPHPGSAALAALTDIASLPAAAEVRPSANEDLLAQLVDEVKAAIEPENHPRLNEVLMMALEACHRGAGFDRVIFCLAAKDRASVRGRIGLGPAIDGVIELLNIPLYGNREPLTLPLLSKRDLFINTLLDDRYQDSQLVAKLGASCFGLYPIVVEDVVVGCIYFDKLTPDAPPSEKTLKTILGLRDMMAELIRRTRAQTQ